MIPHILKDSQQLLQRANEVQTKFSYIFSGDFDSLYLKIKGNHCINLITQFLLSKPQILSNFKLFKIDLNAVNIFLSLIFSCNIFKFKENFYLQLIGLPMGCICGPSVANLFLYILESKWINLNPDIFYNRLIDDVLLISNKEIDIQNFKTFFFYLKLNTETGQHVIFLDLKISINNLTNKLFFSLYIKPTNTFAYLLPTSNHPQHIFKNIPVSLFKRIRRICSSIIDFFHFSRILFIQLLKRGYDPISLNGIIRNISNIDRSQLIPYKIKNKNFLKEDSLKFFIKYDASHDFIKDIYFKSCNLLKNNFIYFKNKNNFIIINQIKNNLGCNLIQRFQFNQQIKYFLKNVLIIIVLLAYFLLNFII